MSVFNYLIGASACMGLGYTLYPLVLKCLTFFSMTRFYLLFIVTISLIIPAIHIKVREPLLAHPTTQDVIVSQNISPEKEYLPPISHQANTANWSLIAGIIYGAICIALLIKMAYSVLKIVNQAKEHGVRSGENYLVMDRYKKNASFFNYIFISSANTQSSEVAQVLAHEETHARLFHSADNLYMEVVKAFFWFNPFVYLIANALNEVHEFEVDHLMKGVFDTKQYASLILKLSSFSSTGLVNQFSAYSLKSRIVMLFSAHSPAVKKLWYLAIVPVLAMYGYWSSVEKVYGKALKKDFVLVLDAGHGGSQYGTVGTGGYTEKDLNLQIVNQIKAIAEKQGIRTILTRPDDSELDLRGRVVYKGDAFISIHLNAPGYWARHTNGMEVIIDKNELYPLNKKLARHLKTSLQQLSGINTRRKMVISETSPDNTLYILRHNKAPAVLLELGYMTDPSDLNYITNTDNQHKIAEKIINAVVAYGTGE
ncbi:N-acetylmuramoyl-L-alanine amidase [Mucilaginibacter gossypiicola]|uniref:N-acetylmuramoyl-L-alanine amidase n=1 Tax=Mucilaginibacter gossypiicola TaxID=551995 RepID=A0A1H8TLW2_9SPHI|nr:N-acetylmuramoyl-L-alanine amidase [Mucilaginibacter gossypiicola]SEO91796.1 N-acetylmuramoyl-L-alanine amidase [Mucilaginibacter gossypiicola]